MRILKIGRSCKLTKIADGQICKGPLTDHPPIMDYIDQSRHMGHAAYCKSEIHNTLLHCVVLYFARKAAVVAGVRNPLSHRHQSAVRGGHCPWLAHQALHISVVHVEGDNPGRTLLQECNRGIHLFQAGRSEERRVGKESSYKWW